MALIKEIEPYYQTRAKELVYLLYDNGFLHDALTRSALDWLEEYCGFLFQSHIEMATRSANLLKGNQHRELSIRGTRPEPDEAAQVSRVLNQLRASRDSRHPEHDPIRSQYNQVADALDILESMLRTEKKAKETVTA